MQISQLTQASTASQTNGIIDCDVHPMLAEGLSGLYPYMPEPWVERFRRKEAAHAAAGLTMRYAHPNGRVVRQDAATDQGGLGGTDPHFLIKDLIEAQNISTVVLNSLQSGAWCAVLSSADESIVIASACNEYYIDRWLPVDDRLTYAPVVPSQDPAAAAAEIRRVGGHRQVTAVAVPALPILFGNRYWWPIFEAAQEMDLPILLHVTGAEGVFAGAPMPAAGLPDTYIERYVTLSQHAESNLNSMIMNGLFERFPRLRVLFVEYGFVWPIPALLRMDRLWRGLRHEVPWVKKSPIDYVNEHVWFTTQPIEEPRDPRDLERLIAMVGVRNLCFSTDYPHWDNDMPMQSFRLLPQEDRDRIMRTNARNVLRLPR
ncbi:amidohydrolase family protein [Roseomonas chloroacetimidivorans]|uniref:amidohydrolase family protein n=1 Tax=Roseomonas chloroacetimidivorans TaxID=1766656 RepID=UPI003C70AA6D